MVPIKRLLISEHLASYLMHYNLSVNSSPHSKVKDEKRPWILRAREASVQIGSKTTSDDSEALPETLIYISCGWESFKEVLLQLKQWVENTMEIDYIPLDYTFWPC